MVLARPSSPPLLSQLRLWVEPAVARLVRSALQQLVREMAPARSATPLTPPAKWNQPQLHAPPVPCTAKCRTRSVEQLLAYTTAALLLPSRSASFAWFSETFTAAQVSEVWPDMCKPMPRYIACWEALAQLA